MQFGSSSKPTDGSREADYQGCFNVPLSQQVQVELEFAAQCLSVNVAVDAGLAPTCGLRQIRASIRLNRHSTTIFGHADRDNEELCLHESLPALDTDRN